MSDSGSEPSSTDFENVLKRCNWCNKYSELAEGKKYCLKCAKKCYKECRRCHRPYDEPKYFKLDNTRCDTCQTAYLKERERRQAKRKATTPATSEPSTAKVAKHEEPVFSFPDNLKNAKVGFIPIFFK